jgi:hypothetical protein
MINALTSEGTAMLCIRMCMVGEVLWLAANLFNNLEEAVCGRGVHKGHVKTYELSGTYL